VGVDEILINTINDIQALNRAVTGVKRAPDLDSYPTVLDTSNLPFVLTWPTEATWHSEGMGGAPKRMDRTFRIICFYEKLGQNDIPTRTAGAVKLLQRHINKFLNPASIPVRDPSDTEPYQVTLERGKNAPHGDSGIRSDLKFGGDFFTGYDLQVRVRVQWSV
jgi:hypothetical protein